MQGEKNGERSMEMLKKVLVAWGVEVGSDGALMHDGRKLVVKWSPEPNPQEFTDLRYEKALNKAFLMEVFDAVADGVAQPSCAGGCER